ncbi:unnamed protein product [Urochloa decumbens]|uniref:F-box domain-containing protein n=1 Tax=Urochloa decumbens TaxID=240449 RepID=A0ABC9GYY9_9POAL
MTATASAARRRIASALAADPPFPDELMEEIFLRLGGAADLARAAAACASFHRIATARPFLRRFRSLHAPPVLGFLDIHSFHPAAPPHSSAPAAAALARPAADFTFSYIPEPSRRWSVVDARDGLVLLSGPIAGAGAGAFADLVVCDPLYRRESKPVAFVFISSGDGNWRRIANHSYSRPPLPQMLFSWASNRSYAHGCFYWIVDYSTDDSYLLVLDTREMKLFATIDLPLRPPNNGVRTIVEAGEEGMLGLLTFDASAIRLFRRSWRKNNASVGAEEEEWQLYKTAAPLPRNLNGNCYDWYRPSCAAGIYLLVLGCESLRKSRCSWHYCTLDLRTLLLERLCVLDSPVISSSHLYSRFPPPFAPPGI